MAAKTFKPPNHIDGHRPARPVVDVHAGAASVGHDKGAKLAPHDTTGELDQGNRGAVSNAKFNQQGAGVNPAPSVQPTDGQLVASGVIGPQ